MEGRDVKHPIRDVNHKEWRDRSEAVGTTNVMDLS